MHSSRHTIVLIAVLFCALITIDMVEAAIITYEATDLTDVNIGEDLWQYRYSVSEHSFSQEHGLTIHFDIEQYAQLEAIQPDAYPDWDLMTFQPDPNAAPSAGLFDALALVDNASLADPFIVNFVWLGSGDPGAQLIEIYGLNFEVMESGDTAAVPLPSSMLLLLSGCLGFLGWRRRITNK